MARLRMAILGLAALFGAHFGAKAWATCDSDPYKCYREYVVSGDTAGNCVQRPNSPFIYESFGNCSTMESFDPNDDSVYYSWSLNKDKYRSCESGPGDGDYCQQGFTARYLVQAYPDNSCDEAHKCWVTRATAGSLQWVDESCKLCSP